MSSFGPMMQEGALLNRIGSFGISAPAHVSVLGGIADAAVVGSALMAEVERAGSVDDAAANVATLVLALKNAARSGLSRRSNQPGNPAAE